MLFRSTPDFTYIIFDYCIDPKEGYSTRMGRLVKMPKIPHIEYLLPVYIVDESELLIYEAKCLFEGYEGVMLRSIHGPYKLGRSTLREGWLLKLKRFSDSEAIILEVYEKMSNQNEAELLAYEAKVLLEGYEGIMIRSPNSPYKFGRSTLKEGWLLKLKRFVDSEATILEIYEQMSNQNEAEKDAFGRTKRSSALSGQIPADTLGGFRVKDLKSGVEFGIGSGFDDRLREEVWNHKEEYIGRIVKYKYQKIGEKIAPRFPVFLGFRDVRDI